MRYAIYFTWNDGTEDSFNDDGTKERDLNIKEMLERKEFKAISFCKIYKSGEYSRRKYCKFMLAYRHDGEKAGR